MRKYLPRAFGLMENDDFVQGTPYHGEQPRSLDIEGYFNDKSFDSFQQLFTIAEWNEDKSQEFANRIQKLFSQNTLK